MGISQSCLKRRVRFAAVALLVLTSASRADGHPARWTLTAFAGQMTDTVRFEIPRDPGEVKLSDVGLFSVGASYSFARMANGASFELEGQIAKYTG